MQNCSDAFRKAIERLSVDLENKKSQLNCYDAISLYALSTVGSPLIQEYVERAKSDEFWNIDFIVDTPGDFFYLHQLGLGANKNFCFCQSKTGPLDHRK